MPVEGEAVIASVRGDAAVIGGGQVLHWPYGPRRLTTRTTPPRDARCRSSRTVWFLLGLNHEAASDDPSGSAQPRSLEKHPLIAGRFGSKMGTGRLGIQGAGRAADARIPGQCERRGGVPLGMIMIPALVTVPRRSRR